MEHDWYLSKEPWYDRDEPCGTTFEWTCRTCGVVVCTSTSHGNVGSHGAHAYKPGPKRLQARQVLVDCDEQVAREVLES